MADDVKHQHSATGATLYMRILNAIGQIWSTVGAAFENFTDANVANYDVAMTEQGTASRLYIGQVPAAIGAQTLSVQVLNQAGGAPAVADALVGVIDAVAWDGSDLQPVREDVAAEVSAVKAKTDQLGFTGANVNADVRAKLSTVPLSTQEKADVNAEVDAALDTVIPGVPTNASINDILKTLDGKFPAGDISDFDEAVDKVTLAAVTHTGATIPDVDTVVAVTDPVDIDMTQAIPPAPGADTVGKALENAHDLIDAAVSSRSSHSAADAGTDAASKVLQNTANKLLTNAGGEVDVNGISAAGLALIKSEADDALSGINLDHLMKVAVALADVTDDSLMAHLLSKSATPSFSSYDNETDSLEAIRDEIGPGVADWSAAEREQIREALGIDGDKTTATGGALQTAAADAALSRKMGTNRLKHDPADDKLKLYDDAGGGVILETTPLDKLGNAIDVDAYSATQIAERPEFAAP
jgi:hypothetical protein